MTKDERHRKNTRQKKRKTTQKQQNTEARDHQNTKKTPTPGNTPHLVEQKRVQLLRRLVPHAPGPAHDPQPPEHLAPAEVLELHRQRFQSFHGAYGRLHVEPEPLQRQLPLQMGDKVDEEVSPRIVINQGGKGGGGPAGGTGGGTLGFTKKKGHRSCSCSLKRTQGADGGERERESDRARRREDMYMKRTTRVNQASSCGRVVHPQVGASVVASKHKAREDSKQFQCLAALPSFTTGPPPTPAPPPNQTHTKQPQNPQKQKNAL